MASLQTGCLVDRRDGRSSQSDAISDRVGLDVRLSARPSGVLGATCYSHKVCYQFGRVFKTFFRSIDLRCGGNLFATFESARHRPRKRFCFSFLRLVGQLSFRFAL